MGTKNNPGSFDCYEAAEPDEPMFVLLARDPLAAHLVAIWSHIREGKSEKAHSVFAALLTNADVQTFKMAPDNPKALEAMQCAMQMAIYRKKRERGKTNAG